MRSMVSRDVDEAVAEMVRVLTPYEARDWQTRAGSLDWSCWTTAAHVAHDLLAYAGQVAAQPGSAYLPFDLVVGADASPRDVLRVIRACGGLLSSVLSVVGPEARAWHWGPTDPGGFAALSDPNHRLRRSRQIRSSEGTQTMGKVIASATVSVDGFIADESDRVGPLFDWYNNGDVPFNGGDPERVFHVSAASAAYMEETWSRIGTAVIGRRLFDITNGWNGRPAVGDAVFVVTHEPPTDWPFPDAPFTFVTDGLASAIAQAKAAAGDKDVSLTGGDLLGQALAGGLVDELQVGLVPVVFGKGVRFFGAYDGPPALLGNPEIVQGDRVTHLRYDVRR